MIQFCFWLGKPDTDIICGEDIVPRCYLGCIAYVCPLESVQIDHGAQIKVLNIVFPYMSGDPVICLSLLVSHPLR